MSNALSTLFWKILSQESCEFIFFCSSASVPYALLSLCFCPPSCSPCITLWTSIFLSHSPLPSSASRECDSLGGRHCPDLLPPAELRWLNCGHPESPPADSLLQRHERFVAANPSVWMHFPFLTFWGSLWWRLWHEHTKPSHFVLFFLIIFILLEKYFTLKIQILTKLFEVYSKLVAVW